MIKKIKGNQGFTLVELLVVIAVIGVLAAAVTPNLFKTLEKSKIASAEMDYKAIKTATMAYYSDTGMWPEDETTGNDPGFMTKVGDVDGWDGPYLERWPAKNPWGGVYRFRNDNNGHRYLELTEVPQTAIDRIDKDLDGDGKSNEGIVQWDGTDLYITISED